MRAAGGGGLVADALFHLAEAVRDRLARRLADDAENLVDLGGVLLAQHLHLGGVGERQALLQRRLGLATSARTISSTLCRGCVGVARLGRAPETYPEIPRPKTSPRPSGAACRNP